LLKANKRNPAGSRVSPRAGTLDAILDKSISWFAIIARPPEADGACGLATSLTLVESSSFTRPPVSNRRHALVFRLLSNLYSENDPYFAPALSKDTYQAFRADGGNAEYHCCRLSAQMVTAGSPRKRQPACGSRSPTSFSPKTAHRRAADGGGGASDWKL